MTTNANPTADQYAAQSQTYLRQSDAEFAAGDDRQGAEKLYGAATQAVMAASIQRGWQYKPHRSNKNAASRLAVEYDDRFLLNGFSIAEKFHVHFHHGDLEDYDIAAERPQVRDYVLRMLNLIQEYDTPHDNPHPNGTPT